MQELRIQLFGPLEVATDQKSLPKFPTRKAKSLFSFLVVHHDRSFRREVLADMFWGDRSEPAARKCLRTELWRIRSVLNGANGQPPLLDVQHDSVGFSLHRGVEVDVVEFERRLAQARELEGEGRANHLRQAVDYCRGELLEGVYDDWCQAPRDRLLAQYLLALDQLMQHHARLREWEAAILYGERILQHDGLIEHVWRALMWCYWQIGNRSAALRRYMQCRQYLAQELEVDPMPETTALFQAIRLHIAPIGAEPSLGPGVPSPANGEADQGQDLLGEIQGYLGQASSRLSQALAEGAEELPATVSRTPVYAGRSYRRR